MFSKIITNTGAIMMEETLLTELLYFFPSFFAHARSIFTRK